MANFQVLHVCRYVAVVVDIDVVIVVVVVDVNVVIVVVDVNVVDVAIKTPTNASAEHFTQKTK